MSAAIRRNRIRRVVQKVVRRFRHRGRIGGQFPVSVQRIRSAPAPQEQRHGLGVWRRPGLLGPPLVGAHYEQVSAGVGVDSVILAP